MRRFLLPLLAVSLLSGCYSVEASRVRERFAARSEMETKITSENQRKRAMFYLEELGKLELNKMNEALKRQNILAKGVDSRIAQNYIEYFNGLEKLKAELASRRAEIEADHATLLQLSAGYGYLSSMADEELKVGDELAKASLDEAIKQGELVFKTWQQANPPSLPADQKKPAPEPDGPILDQWGNPIPDNTPVNP